MTARMTKKPVDIDIQKLIDVLPKLIRENDTVKGAVISALSGVVATKDDIKELIKEMDNRFVATKDDIKELIKEMDKRFEEMDKRFEEMDKRFEEMDKRFEKMDKRFEKMDKRFEDLHGSVSRISLDLATLSGRSGDDLEAMVRDLMADTLVKHKIDVSNVEKASLVDVDGSVFTPGYSTEVDVVATNGKIYLYEIKFRADQRDAYHFMQVAKLYEIVNECTVDRLVMLVLEISNATLRAIARFPVEIDVIVGSVVP
jgi:hypothetical protein